MITIRHDVFFHADPGTEATLAQLVRAVSKLVIGVRIMNADVQKLVDAVAAQRGDIASMKTFISGLEQAVKDALAGVTLPPAVTADLAAVFSDLSANTQEIKDAIDNDPATPAAPPA